MLPMYPFWIVALAYAQFALFCSRRRLVKWLIFVAVAVVIGLMVLEDRTAGPSGAKENWPIATLLVGIWVMTVPVAILSGGALAISRLTKELWRQVSLIFLVLLTMFFWPIFALFSVCASGIDCL